VFDVFDVLGVFGVFGVFVVEHIPPLVEHVLLLGVDKISPSSVGVIVYDLLLPKKPNSLTVKHFQPFCLGCGTLFYVLFIFRHVKKWRVYFSDVPRGTLVYVLL